MVAKRRLVVALLAVVLCTACRVEASFKETCSKNAQPCGTSSCNHVVLYPAKVEFCHNQQLLVCAGPAVDPCKGKACEPGTHCERDACGYDDLCEVSCIPDETVRITAMDMEEPSNTPVVTDVPSGSSGIATVPVTVPPTELPSPRVNQLSSSPSSPASNVLGSSASVPASNLAGSISSSAGSNSCPDGSPQVRCLADPCAASPCLKGTLCVSNYCGGEQSTCRA